MHKPGHWPGVAGTPGAVEGQVGPPTGHGQAGEQGPPSWGWTSGRFLRGAGRTQDLLGPSPPGDSQFSSSQQRRGKHYFREETANLALPLKPGSRFSADARRGLTAGGQQRPPVEAPRQPGLGRGREVPFQVVGGKPARGHRPGQAPRDKFTATHFFSLCNTRLLRSSCMELRDVV